jgi:hypothetical protein
MSSESVEQLAAAIGENVYIDLAKWHLYLRDAKLHTVLADKLYPLMSDGKLSDSQVTDVLKGISVQLGGGKVELPLADLLPSQSQANLMDAIAEFQRNL